MEFKIVSIKQLYPHLWVAAVEVEELSMVISSIYLVGSLKDCNMEMPSREDKPSITFKDTSVYNRLKNLLVMEAVKIRKAENDKIFEAMRNGRNR